MVTVKGKVNRATHRAAVDVGHFSGFHDDETIEAVESLIEPHVRAAVAAQKEFDAKLMIPYVPICGRNLAKIIRDGGPDERG
jgi:hypothetical protein